MDAIIANGMNFSILFNPARTEVGGYFDILMNNSNGYYGTNLGDFYTKAVQHIYDNTGKSTGVVEPDPEVPKPISNYVDVSGDIILGNFSEKVANISTIYDGEKLYGIIIKDDQYSDYDWDGLSDSDEVDWSGLKLVGNEYKCHSYGDWRAIIEYGSTAGFSNTLLSIKVLPIFSNPWEKDSDNDGYTDYDEVKIYESDPIVNNVNLYRWGKEYISVDYEGTEYWDNNGSNVSFGGSQSWMFDSSSEQWYSWLQPGYRIRYSGCGLISFADILLYLALSDPSFEIIEESVIIKQNESGNIAYDSYRSYIYYMYLTYLNFIPSIGANGFSIASSFNTISSLQGLGLNAVWCTSPSGRLGKIINMLNNDIPVTLSIGPVFPGKDGGVMFYDWLPKEHEPYNFEINNYKYKVNAHYVTITGLMIDDVRGKAFLEISSWGRKYYINYDEYIDFIDCYSSSFVSNILYIER